MDPSSQPQPLPYSPMDELGFPTGMPLTREHLNDVAPLAKDLQDRLDAIMRQAG